MHKTIHDGVVFIEGKPPQFRSLGPVEVSIGGILRSAQLRSLDDVKSLLAKKVKAAGGNALVDFKYGQRSVGLLASFFQRDDVDWYGSGLAAVVN